MAKIAPLADVGSLANTTAARAVINDNSQKIEDAFQNTLSRDGSAPNQMEADIDLNDHFLLNVADPVNEADGVNLRSVRPLVAQFASEIVETAVLGSTVVDTYPLASVGQTTFSLSEPPGDVVNVEFYVNGIAYIPGTDFQVSGPEFQTVTLTTPLVGGEEVFARYAIALPPLDNSTFVRYSELADGVTTGKGADLVAYDATDSVREKIAGYEAETHLWTEVNQWGSASTNFIQHNLPTDTNSALQYIRREVSPSSSMRCGGLYQNVIRDGGSQNGAGWTEYFLRNGTASSGFDIAQTDVAVARKINGGTLLGYWNITLSPSIADQPNGAQFTGKVYSAEFNYGNRWQDFGLSRNINSGSWVGGILLVPDVVLGPDGFSSVDGHFNASFGLVFGPAKSGAAQRRTWTLIHADDDSVPAGGLHMCMRGGSTSGNAPLALLEARDNWNNLIDFTNATIVGHAVKLAAAHTVVFGDRELGYGDAIPVSGQWLRGSVRFNNLAMTAQDIAPAWMNVGSGTPGNWAQFGEIIYNGQKTFDPPSIAAAGTTTTTVTVTGAALGDFADASFSLSLAGLVVTAYVSAANTVTVVFFNPTGGAVDLASGTLRARVRKA